MRPAPVIPLLLLVSTLSPVPAAAPDEFGILPQAPMSHERGVPIEALKKKAPALAETFTRHAFRNSKGEEMPYRLFTPAPVEKGRTYPLVVFLHGAAGGGTDYDQQLQGGNMFGALVWTRAATT